MSRATPGWHARGCTLGRMAARIRSWALQIVRDNVQIALDVMGWSLLGMCEVMRRVMNHYDELRNGMARHRHRPTAQGEATAQGLACCCGLQHLTRYSARYLRGYVYTGWEKRYVLVEARGNATDNKQASPPVLA